MMRFWLMFMSMFLPVICWGQIIVKETGGHGSLSVSVFPYDSDLL